MVRAFFFISLVVLFSGLGGCGRPQLNHYLLEGDMESGRAAWARMVKLQSLQAQAVLSWKSTDSSHGKYRVRLFLVPPEHMKIQWLTPWGSVAGQLLLRDRQFWFSDAQQRLTWHGRSADLGQLLQNQGYRNWAAASQFFTNWPLLFSLPVEDDTTFAAHASISYLTTDAGRYLNKVVSFNNGDEMHIRLDDLVPVADQHFLPRNFEVLSHAGQISLTLKQFQLLPELGPETFVYNLESFTLRECLIPEANQAGGESLN
ncbi:MAG: hypothetical protein JXR80_06135 [Deltaproteobacteria bacterium]|nr:hypothetical protein [Deltaproteobacteria bacterium]